MKEVMIVEHDNSFKGTWYHAGQSFIVKDEDAPSPHLPGFYQPVGLDHSGTIDKTHCFVLRENVL